MKETKTIFIPIFLAMALLLAGHLIWQAFHARPVPILEETDAVRAITMNESLSSHAESPFPIPEEYDENQLLTRLSQSEMVWVEHLHKGESTHIGKTELWISVLLEDEGFVDIHLGQNNLVQTANALYEITDGEALLADIKALLAQEDTVLLGEGYSTYPVMLYEENTP